jgi:Flp pilus assembly pilin Flp
MALAGVVHAGQSKGVCVMKKILKKLAFPRFMRAEDGLVTIEWVGIAAIASVAAIAVAGGVYETVGTKAATLPGNLCTNATSEGSAIAGQTSATGITANAC